MRIDIKGCIVPNDDAWIYGYFGIDCCCPNDVNEHISKANGEKLDIYINSGGGDIFAGSEIYSAIREYGGEVKIHVVGLAASAASVIACAASSEISPTAMVMVHNVSSIARGDYRDLSKEGDILKKANETIANAYVAKTGMTLESALKMMDDETWLSANDAVAKGLIDKIAENQNVKLVASYDSGMLPQSVINRMKEQRLEDSNAVFLRNQAQAKLDLEKLKGRVL